MTRAYSNVVTVLAFIYVPLNLATSIFGMNIYQLNESGQSFWVFLITALVAMLVTVSAWYLTEQVNSYRKWYEANVRNGNIKDDERPTPPEQARLSLMMKANMLIGLSLSSSKYWVIKKGIWWRFLTNSSSRMCNCSNSYCEGWTTVEVILYLLTSRREGYPRGRFCELGKDDNEWIWKSNPRGNDTGD